MSTFLVTGGAGYIGSHVVLALLQSKAKVIILDNLCNSSVESLNRVSTLVKGEMVFIEGDIRDRMLLDRIFLENRIDAVFHLAGLKAVSKSISQPLNYYDNNVYGSQVLLQACTDAGIFKFVFSSSATVYGESMVMPISEDYPALRPINPYGRCKLIVENMLHDLAVSDPRWQIAILRYFNPVGAHESGQIGEDPNDIPNNLLPFITKVAMGKLPELSIFGNDYPTPDGTCIRDYIHVMDLADGHLRALKAIKVRFGVHVWNLGTGQGYSVLEIVHAFEIASSQRIAYKIGPRRPGDIAICFADPTKAERELGWEAKRGLDEIIRDAWQWQSLNPNGFKN